MLDFSFLVAVRTGVFPYSAIQKDLNTDSSVWQGRNINPGAEWKQEANMERQKKKIKI